MTDQHAWEDEPAEPNPEIAEPPTDALTRKAPPLLAELESFRVEPGLDDVEAGSTPLPEEWQLLRAVFGGIDRRTLEDYSTTDPKARGGTALGLAWREALDYGRLSRGLHVFTGHTGGGKTALAINLVRAAVRAGHPAVYASLELDRPELAARLIALEGAYLDRDQERPGLTWSRIALRRPLARDREERERRNRLKLAAIDALREAMGRLYVWAPDPKPGEGPPTVMDLRELVQCAWEENGKRAPLVVFDYLQAPGIYAQDPERETQIRERIGSVTMALRHISKASENMGAGWIGCPVVVLSTTARSNVRTAFSGKGKGGEEEPSRFDPLAGMDGRDPDLLRFASLEDLKALPKEAGEVEATSVTSWALSLERGNTTGPKRLALRLAKNRQGPDGQWIPLRFSGGSGRITEEPDRYAAAQTKDTEGAQEGGEERGAAGMLPGNAGLTLLEGKPGSNRKGRR